MISQSKPLLITPPFTQLNTPYPATAYIKGFLNTLGVPSLQVDLGIEVILALFSPGGLTRLFETLDQAEYDIELSDNAYRIYLLRNEYIATIEPVILFLQNKNPTLAHSICDRSYLPEATRFKDVEDLGWAFGAMGTQDKARHLATLYLEDLGDFIQEAIDPHFGFSRYAERLGRTATHFDELHASLEATDTLITTLLIELLDQKIKAFQPNVVCLTIPFPGNLFGAFKCGQYLKQHYPDIKIVMGGGFCNTELRSLSDPRVFDYVDFVCLDDGEAPLRSLLEYVEQKRPLEKLKRIFSCIDGQVVYHNGATEKDIAQRETGTPDYTDLMLMEYLSVIEIVNPMHRLWSDGRWNKLTLAHGCYWGKCSFCDISLDYIKNYEPLTASLICDRIEEIIQKTKQNGFHFVDEAAPPALLRDLAIEIIRRKLTVVWWTNIRFEKNFTHDLSILLKASGCIAMSGGLEVASDRLLLKMQKGVTVGQVARVTDGFTQAGIMVHAYLMYGFPTQTTQETIDSLEMVRQLFENGVLQSGFWHRFAMTSHSPVGFAPEAFDVQRIGPEFGGFADNDLYHDDPTGANHGFFSEGLRKSLFNYMHGVGFEIPLAKWFNSKVPPTTIPANYIQRQIVQREDTIRKNAFVIWLGNVPTLELFEVKQGKKTMQMSELHFYHKKHDFVLELPASMGEFWMNIFPKIAITNFERPFSYQQLQATFEAAQLGSFDTFCKTDSWRQLRENGLLVL